MKSVPNINMAAVTRLTREGRLADAMHVLRGGLAPEPACDARPAPVHASGDDEAVIDMEPPSPANGGAWTAPSAPPATPKSPSSSTRIES